MFEKKQSKKVSKKKMEDEYKVIPSRDFVISHNGYYIELKEGVPCEVPPMFLENLKTEKII